MAKDTEKKKKKRPTAKKRDIQNEKRRIINKAFKSEMRTAIRNFQEALKKDDLELVKNNLNSAYSLLDKAVKRGQLKRNAVSRTKSRLAARAATKG